MTDPHAQMSFLSRGAFMAMGWGAIGVIYTISGQRNPQTAHRLDPSAIDLWFTFEPAAIWI